MNREYELIKLGEAMDAVLKHNLIIIAWGDSRQHFYDIILTNTQKGKVASSDLLSLCEVSENNSGRAAPLQQLPQHSSDFFKKIISSRMKIIGLNDLAYNNSIFIYPIVSCSRFIHSLDFHTLDEKIEACYRMTRSLLYSGPGRKMLVDEGFFNRYHDSAYYRDWIKSSHENYDFYRTDVIQALIDKHGYKNYLEIGFARGENFYQIKCERKHTVDPGSDYLPTQDSHNEFFHKCTSDDFYKMNKENYDLIFIDGLHTYEQVKKDIVNSLDILVPGGTIILHDLNPRNWYQQAFPPENNGDCWKAFVELRNTRSDLEMMCVNTDNGCGILRRGKQKLYDDPNFRLDYEYFDQRRHEMLNLISVENFKELISDKEMILIAHRGNTEGSNEEMENNPSYVQNAIKKGFDVEIDVWYTDDGFVLGHDKPQYPIEENFLKNEALWCHAKNVEALDAMVKIGVHCFWHQEDDYTLTSRGHVWIYPGEKPSKSGIMVSKSFDPDLIEKCLGICSDDIMKYKEIMDSKKECEGETKNEINLD